MSETHTIPGTKSRWKKASNFFSNAVTFGSEKFHTKLHDLTNGIGDKIIVGLVGIWWGIWWASYAFNSSIRWTVDNFATSVWEKTYHSLMEILHVADDIGVVWWVSLLLASGVWTIWTAAKHVWLDKKLDKAKQAEAIKKAVEEALSKQQAVQQETRAQESVQTNTNTTANFA